MNKTFTGQSDTEYILDNTSGPLSIPSQRKKLFELAVVPNMKKNVRKYIYTKSIKCIVLEKYISSIIWVRHIKRHHIVWTLIISRKSLKVSVFENVAVMQCIDYFSRWPNFQIALITRLCVVRRTGHFQRTGGSGAHAPTRYGGAR